MNTAYKLLALDIDGTLLPEFGSTLSPRLREGLHRAADCIDLALITGRSYEDVQPVLEDLRLPGVWLALGGGAEVRSPEGEILWQTAFTSEVLDDLLSYLAQRRTVKVLQAGNWIQPQARQTGRSVQALYVDSLKLEEAEALEREGAKEFPDLYVSLVTDSSSAELRSVFFQPRSATKGEALREIQGRLSVTIEQTAAAGDMNLDIPMFSQSGLSAAMGNAPDGVKALARVVLPDVRSDGILALLEMVRGKEVA